MGVETKGRTFTSRAERWEGGRERRDEGEGRVPNTSEPFYKVNKMEAATAYPRLNATSYFESSSNASLSPLLSLPSWCHPLAQFLFQARCSRQDAPMSSLPPSSPSLAVPPCFFSSTDKRKAIPPGKGGNGRPFATILPRILRANGQFA